MNKICKISKCKNPYKARGMCSGHWQQWRKGSKIRPLRTRHSGGRRGWYISHKLMYFSYYQMLQRCNNPNHKSYKNYGGRGVKVCGKWVNSFEDFYVDMGERPLGKSLDRIDNDGNYEPDNCRWADWITQNNNRRDNIFVDV